MSQMHFKKETLGDGPMIAPLKILGWGKHLAARVALGNQPITSLIDSYATPA